MSARNEVKVPSVKSEIPNPHSAIESFSPVGILHRRNYVPLCGMQISEYGLVLASASQRWTLSYITLNRITKGGYTNGSGGWGGSGGSRNC